MTKLNAARERTEAKLKYAAIHLDELRRRRVLYGSQIGDWERAHQESFLFHLLGVRDALLQEINLFHACGLKMRNVSIGRISQRLVKSGSVSAALRILMKLEGMRSTWLSIAKRLRNTSTHQKNVPRQLIVDGANDDPQFFRDPLTGKWIETNCIDLFAQWHGKAIKLIKNLRGKMPGAENG